MNKETVAKPMRLLPKVIELAVAEPQIKTRSWLILREKFFPLDQGFQPFSSHGTHELTTKIVWHAKQYMFFADLTKKNRYNFVSFTPDSSCSVGCCNFFI